MRFHLVRERLDRGGYASNGRYFGVGLPVYYFCHDPAEEGCWKADSKIISGFVRGNTRALAKAEVKALHKGATFYR